MYNLETERTTLSLLTEEDLPASAAIALEEDTVQIP